MAAANRRKRRRRRARYSPVVPVLGLVLVCLTAAVLWVLLRHRGLPGEDIEVPDYVEQDYLTVNEWSRPGTELEQIDGVVIHYVGNPGTTAHANRNYFESLSSGQEGTYASSHFIVALEGEVIQGVPLTEVAYASNERNADTVSIEVCHPDETGEFSPVTYDRAVELTAWLCVQFKLDPETGVIRHYAVPGKECPRYYVEHPEAWDAFRADVSAAIKELETANG